MVKKQPYLSLSDLLGCSLFYKKSTLTLDSYYSSEFTRQPRANQGLLISIRPL